MIDGFLSVMGGSSVLVLSFADMMVVEVDFVALGTKPKSPGWYFTMGVSSLEPSVRSN